jgi:predicted nucleic acid-binding protein
LLGCLRVLANPAYPEKRALMTIVESLRSLCDVPDHIHWADGPNVLTSVDITQLRGHRQITDAFLLATAVAHGGRLVTFDRNVPVRAVAGATPDHVEVLS